jgi:hypothetical protein
MDSETRGEVGGSTGGDLDGIIIAASEILGGSPGERSTVINVDCARQSPDIQSSSQRYAPAMLARVSRLFLLVPERRVRVTWDPKLGVLRRSAEAVALGMHTHTI